MKFFIIVIAAWTVNTAMAQSLSNTNNSMGGSTGTNNSIYNKPVPSAGTIVTPGNTGTTNQGALGNGTIVPGSAIGAPGTGNQGASSASCTTATGQLFSQNDVGYNDCLRSINSRR
jgi:hypothetical protein